MCELLTGDMLVGIDPFVRNWVCGYVEGGWKEQGGEGGRRTEDRGLRTEDRGRRTEDGGLRQRT
jgi:hypothetical protein